MARIADKDRKVKSAKERKVEDHIVGKATVKETVDNNGGHQSKDIEWDVTAAEVHSDTTLESDTGYGKAVVLRFFDFLAQREAFRQHTPSKQELFNAHQLQIQSALYLDDLKIYEEVPPKVMISKNRRYYRIVVAALPSGTIHKDIPTLSQIANDTRPNTN